MHIATSESVLLQGLAFLQRYERVRGRHMQETQYNLGRAMHQLGLYPQACMHYKRVLELDLPDVQLPTEPFERELPGCLSELVRA